MGMPRSNPQVGFRVLKTLIEECRQAGVTVLTIDQLDEAVAKMEDAIRKLDAGRN